MLKITGVTHWSIPVNDLEESERFYRDVLGLEYRGRLGNSRMACFRVGEHNILLCERNEPLRRTPEQDNRLHHAFEVSPEEWERAARLFYERGVPLAEPIVYREHGFFPGREMYFLDPSGNMLELRDPTWTPDKPRPTFEEIVGAAQRPEG
ncbi:MAG TPA: VOC family protein [Chloroflexota bacterium]|jgi:catechol 2,3-dioxygenase-like lactoylglutathione lyase family enzyme|nr:VOC family protein [Chloroflexota bacterium]HZU06256.1 VOC family protein [Chloroflexota bacterium]